MSRRAPRRGVRTGKRDWLWALAFIVFFVVIAGGAILALSGSSSKGQVIATVSGVNCERDEQLRYHVHSRLSVVIEGTPVEVPSSIGIRPDCLFWLHTHSPDGLIHVEAPEQRDFTLGQFFAVWGKTLTATQILDRTVDASHSLQATVNGEPWQDDPSLIPLSDQVEIVLQYGPPFTQPRQ